MKKDIVCTKLADEKKDISYAWQAKSEYEANNLVKYLKDHGVEAKTVTIEYFKNWE